MLYRIWRVGGADEGYQSDDVLPGEIAQDIIGANLWTGVKWVRQDLGQEENFLHGISDYNLSTFAFKEYSRTFLPLKRLSSQRHFKKISTSSVDSVVDFHTDPKEVQSYLVYIFSFVVKAFVSLRIQEGP